MNHISQSAVDSLDAWPAVRERILADFQTVTGPWEATSTEADLEIEVTDEVDCGSYIRRHLTYVTDPGCPTPAYLCIPAEATLASPARAVLCPHPTHQRDGNKVVVGLSDRENRSYAAELAERGFVTFAPAYPHLADYEPDLSALGYASGTMKAVHDNSRALDYLTSLPFVTARHGFASVGHSLGGHNSIFSAVFDQRIRVIISSCGFDSFLDYAFHHPEGRGGWCQDRYMPRIADYALPDIPFDFHDLLAALAPRPCFISAPIHDTNFKYESVAAVVDAARTIYALHDAAEHLYCEHPDYSHDFPDEVRLRAYNFIDRHLKQ